MAAAAVRTQASFNPNISCTSKTILVVEDEIFVCDVTCGILEQHGYGVLRAGNAAAARILFSQHAQQLKLLFCDAVLPDGNGIELARAFHKLSPTLKVIIASGYPQSQLNEECSAEPETEFLTKPYASSRLIATVRRLLSENEAAAGRVA